MRILTLVSAAAAAALIAVGGALAQYQVPPNTTASLDPSYDPGNRAPVDQTYSEDELVAAGHTMFGEASAGVASVIEHAMSRFGQPDAYVIGQEGSGAIFGGLRYGEGTLRTREGDQPVFWQGPSLGWDLGGNGSRVMMLVYNLPNSNTLMQRYTGVDGSAFVVAGASMTVMAADTTYLVPVRTGVGARLGFSLGYLKFTPEPTWNPF